MLLFPEEFADRPSRQVPRERKRNGPGREEGGGVYEHPEDVFVPLKRTRR